jgi:predicted transcriptional regulator
MMPAKNTMAEIAELFGVSRATVYCELQHRAGKEKSGQRGQQQQREAGPAAAVAAA